MERTGHRDLLFVVLAMQMGFVTREQMVEAGALWAADRSLSLLDIWTGLA